VNRGRRGSRCRPGPRRVPSNSRRRTRRIPNPWARGRRRPRAGKRRGSPGRTASRTPKRASICRCASRQGAPTPFWWLFLSWHLRQRPSSSRPKGMDAGWVERGEPGRWDHGPAPDPLAGVALRAGLLLHGVFVASFLSHVAKGAVQARGVVIIRPRRDSSCTSPPWGVRSPGRRRPEVTCPSQ